MGLVGLRSTQHGSVRASFPGVKVLIPRLIAYLVKIFNLRLAEGWPPWASAIILS